MSKRVIRFADELMEVDEADADPPTTTLTKHQTVVDSTDTIQLRNRSITKSYADVKSSGYNPLLSNSPKTPLKPVEKRKEKRSEPYTTPGGALVINPFRTSLINTGIAGNTAPYKPPPRIMFRAFKINEKAEDLIADYARKLPSVKYLTGRESFERNGVWRDGCSICPYADVHPQRRAEHIKLFHPDQLYMCPFGSFRHMLPVVAYEQEKMVEHLKEGHSEMFLDKEDEVPVPQFRSIDLSLTLKPLLVQRNQLTFPYIQIGQSSHSDLLKVELVQPERLHFKPAILNEGNNHVVSLLQLNAIERGKFVAKISDKELICAMMNVEI